MKRALIIRCIKLLVLGALLGLVYYTLLIKNDFTSLRIELTSNSYGYRVLYLVLTVMMMPLNWYIEAIKWKATIIEHHEISTRRSIKSILVGLSLAIITPARSGEYLGRLAFLSKKVIPTGLMATLLCSIAQNLVTVIAGISVIAFEHYDVTLLNGHEVEVKIFGLVGVVILFAAFFKVDKLLAQLMRIEWLGEKMRDYSSSPSSLRVRIEVLLLAILRYVVYLSQYVLIIWFFGYMGSMTNLVAAIIIIYLIQVLLPLPPLSSLAARGEVSILVLSSIGINPVIALISSLIMWVINLVIPALVGLSIRTDIERSKNEFVP